MIFLKKHLFSLLTVVFVLLVFSWNCQEEKVSPTTEITPANTDIIYFRTNQQSFNYWYYGMIYQGNLYVKTNTERNGITGDWQMVEVPEELKGKAVELSMDDDNIVVMRDDRKMFRCGSTYAFDVGLIDSIYNWGTYNSFPFNSGPVLFLPDNVLKWDYSVVSYQQDIHYTDHVGNKFDVGEAKCSHIIALKEGNRSIAFNDIWLPPDLNFEICGPYRGTFKSIALSSSGSTHFIMNQFGDMFTILFDYDISGPDRLFLQYSYYDQTGLPNPVMQLPPAPWTMQTKINGRITDRISMHKIDVDCIHRILRVEGWNNKGETGFYQKDITESEWQFVKTGLPILGNEIENKAYDSSKEDLLEPEDFYFSHNMDNRNSLSDMVPVGGFTNNDWAGELTDYNCYCSPVQLKVYITENESLDLTLHTSETLRTTPRTTRGLDNDPRDKDGTIEIPLSILNNLGQYSEKAQEFIHFYANDQRFTWARIKASLSQVTVSIEGTEIVWEFNR